MTEALAKPRRTLSLQGRCSRAANLWFQAASIVFILAAFLVWSIIGSPLWPTIISVGVILIPLSIVFSVRRLHDVGLSGWFVLVCFAPIVGWIFSWALIFKRGQVGPNRFAEDPLKLEAPRPSRPVQEWTLAAMVALVVMAALVGLRIFVFQPYTIPSDSMGPTLNKGDYVIVSKSAYGFSKHSIPFSPPLFQGRTFNKIPQRGDIVVFKSPRDTKVDYIRRLIGLPGDRLQIRSGVVFVNDKPIERTLVSNFMDDLGDGTPIPAQIYRETTSGGARYLTKSYITDQAAENTGVYVTPPHCYFLLGDNRDNSLDSRFDPNMSDQPIGPSNCGWDASVDAYIPGAPGTGFVPEENLVGQAVLVVAPTGKPRFRWLIGR